MRTGIAAALVLAVVGGALHAAADPAGPGQAEDLGRRLFVSDCASCHGVDGRGIDGQGPSLERSGEAAAHFYITSGRMPMATVAQQSRRKPVTYDEEEVDALVAYVASLGRGPEIPDVDPDEGDLTSGNLLYSANCASCHNSAGSGGALGQAIFAPPVYPATPLQVAEAIRVGPGAMPAFGPGALDDDQLADVVRYVTFLDDPVDRGGAPLGRVGPIPEGLVAWIVGLGLLLVCARWIGTRERPR